MNIAPAIEFVYFDLGNVLLNFDHHRACRQLADTTGVDTQRIWQIVFAGELEEQFERGEISRKEFADRLAGEIGCRPDYPQWEEAAADIFTPNTDVIDLIGELNVRQTRLGILSNTNTVHWDFVQARYRRLFQLFGVFALSFELARMKPDAEIYGMAAQLAGVPPERIFFVDDRVENVEAALCAGWDAVRYTSVAALREQLMQRNLLT